MLYLSGAKGFTPDAGVIGITEPKQCELPHLVMSIDVTPDTGVIGITEPKQCELPHLVTSIGVIFNAGLIGTIRSERVITLSSCWNESYA